MKRRLYYLANDFDSVDRIAELLHKQGLSDWNFHVFSKDDVGLYKHHLHSATPWHTRDIWRQGERGALIGFVLGAIAASVIVGGLGFFQNHFALATVIILALVTMNGAWIGGLVGIGTENYKIKRFHSDIDSGRILLMIDAAAKERDNIQRLLRSFPLQACGDDSVVALPFTPTGHGQMAS